MSRLEDIVQVLCSLLQLRHTLHLRHIQLISAWEQSCKQAARLAALILCTTVYASAIVLHTAQCNRAVAAAHAGTSSVMPVRHAQPSQHHEMLQGHTVSSATHNHHQHQHHQYHKSPPQHTHTHTTQPLNASSPSSLRICTSRMSRRLRDSSQSRYCSMRMKLRLTQTVDHEHAKDDAHVACNRG